MRKRLWFEVHSWLGIFSGLILFIICWSGTVAVFSNEIDWLLNTDWQLSPVGQPLSWGKLEESLLQAFPEALSYSLHAPLYENFPAHAIIDTTNQAYQMIYLHPYTGEVIDTTSYFNVQRFFRSFHMSLFDFGSGKLWGYWFVTFFSFSFLISILTPLIFYKRWWRGFYTLKSGRGSRIFWSHMHKFTGVWSLLFGLIIGITGLWYFAELFDVDFNYPILEPVEISQTDQEQIPLDGLVSQANTLWPELDITAITAARGSFWGDVVRMEGQAEAWLVRDRANFLTLNPFNGELIKEQRADELSWPTRWVDTADPLHFGSFAGIWVKGLWFILGLALSSLCLTGAYLHICRLKSNTLARKRFRWPGTFTAVIFTILILLWATWGGWHEINGYGPLLGERQVMPEIPTTTTIFISIWVALTFFILSIWSWFVLKPGK